MIIDCDSCQVRGLACGDCVIGVLMGVPAPDEAAAGPTAAGVDAEPEGPSGAPVVQFDAPERRALAVLADQGLIPRLRLVAPDPRRAHSVDDGGNSVRDAG